MSRVLHGVGLGLAGAVLFAVALICWASMAVSAAWNAVYGDRAKTRRWRRTPGLAELMPGSPGWADREARVSALLAAVEALSIERFDTFDPSGVVGWTQIYKAADGAPPTVRAVVEAIRGTASRAVVGRAERDRPEAGAEDYTLHNAWLLFETHWQAAERAVVAGSIAILLEGHLDEAARADWAAAAARLGSVPLGA